MTDTATFQAFVNDLQLDDTPLISPTRFAERLALEQQQLAQYAHVHRNTVARLPGSAALQEYMQAAVRVIHAATTVSGDTNKALYWYRNQPLQPFGFKTAAELVSDGKTEGVLKYLDSIDAGASG